MAVTARETILPFYARAVIIIIGLLALFTVLYIAQGIIVPIVFSIIAAILLQPVVDFLTRRRINRIIAIVITLLLTFVILAAFGALLFSQASRFSESWPVFVDKFTLMLDQTVSWASGYFDINPRKIQEWITKTKTELIGNSSAMIGQTLVTVGGVIVVILLVPVYIFMILFYQPLLLDFIRKLSGTSHQQKVGEIVTQTKTVIQRYLIGLVIEMVIVATLDSAALFILGVEYAILLGIIGAMLNLIPYIGGLVAVALPMMVALATKPSAWTAVYVLILYYAIQLFDNNFIVPKIVASKVKINALFSIIVVLAGNALWGIPGMFLSIPLLAIVKLVCDHVDSLKPLGFLLGDTMPPLLKIPPILNKLKMRSK